MHDGFSPWDFAGAVLDIRTVLAVLALAVAATTMWRTRLLSSRLARQGNRLRALADVSFNGLILARAGTVVEVNAALARLMGVGTAWFQHRSLAALLDAGAGEHPHPPVEEMLVLPDGRRHPVQVARRSVHGSTEQVLAIRDLSDQKTTQTQIERLMHADLLTGVGNRQALEKSISKLISMAERTAGGFALLRIDLDRFRVINDSLGPEIGDRILIEAARRLSATVRTIDTVARIGSDEFAILQPLTGKPADAAALADRVITELALPFDVDGHMMIVGASIGVAMYPGDGATSVDLLTRSAMALRRARKGGRGTWRYCEPAMDALMREQQSLAQDLGVALAEGQLSLVYQPFFDTASLEMTGFEALARWLHPQRGIISPAQFIPIAEEWGLIVPLSDWVLCTACAEAATWTNPLRIAINLSPAQFMQENVAARVGCVLRETGLEPSRLELEITEGVLMHDTEEALQTLTALRDLGVKLTLDDFGTGYSSLSYLRKFPFDKLKIDRSFIRDLDEDTDARPIVQAIIALSRSLRLEVTAEGVERERQLAYLRQEGCAFVQGYLLGHPQPAASLRWNTRPAGWEPDLLGGEPQPAQLPATGD